MRKILIAYYSWSNGNTERIAKMLQKGIGGDLLKIETEVPYPNDYETVVEQGQKEVNEGYKPKLKETDIDISDYDVIAIGTPTWWYTMAPSVLTFLTENDFSHKQVILFMTNGGWPGHVIKDMENAINNAEIISKKEIQFDSNGKDYLETPLSEIESWIQSVKVTIGE